MNLQEKIEAIISAIVETNDEDRRQELVAHLRELQQLQIEEVTCG